MRFFLTLLFLMSGTAFSQAVTVLDKAGIDSMLVSGTVHLRAGTYIFPADFSYDLGARSLTLTGVPGKTIITSWDGSKKTNFQPRELDTNAADDYSDGLYVVKKHPVYSYGGGFAHLNLKGSYNTGGKNCFYTQGTILKKDNGIWSRHYTGYGFRSSGNFIIKDIIFDNCEFYLFSPFGQATTDLFEITNCSFRNISRVIASMNYAGVDQSPDWFGNLQVYSSSGVFRFRDFVISNCRFEKIHTSIVWGFPPSIHTRITGNVIEHCSTMITAFNLFMKNYADESYFNNRCTQTITGNLFRDIITANGWTTSLVRTSGLATVTNNRFIDITPQACYLSGGDATFSNNLVSKYNDASPLQSPALLIKSSSKSSITGNTINCPISTLIQLEGTGSVEVTNNSLVGYSRYRYISTSTTALLKDRVYNIADEASFRRLAINYGKDIVKGNQVYFNRTTDQWEKLDLNYIGFVFSKNDPGGSPGQSLTVTGNTIQAEGITNISSKGSSSFNAVLITENIISYARYLHLGISRVGRYNFSNNTLMDSKLAPVERQVEHLVIEDNQ